MRKWRIEDSEELYNIPGWGRNYFSVNERGHMVVTPRAGYASVDLKEVMDELQVRDISAPVLLRFPDILDNRIEKISNCFRNAAQQYDYKAQNYMIYPIKVNQMRQKVQHRPRGRFQARTACRACNQYSRKRPHNLQRI